MKKTEASPSFIVYDSGVGVFESELLIYVK